MKFTLVSLALLSGASAFTAPVPFVGRASPMTPIRMSESPSDGMGGIYDDLGFKQEDRMLESNQHG